MDCDYSLFKVVQISQKKTGVCCSVPFELNSLTSFVMFSFFWEHFFVLVLIVINPLH